MLCRAEVASAMEASNYVRQASAKLRAHDRTDRAVVRDRKRWESRFMHTEQAASMLQR